MVCWVNIIMHFIEGFIEANNHLLCQLLLCRTYQDSSRSIFQKIIPQIEISLSIVAIFSVVRFNTNHFYSESCFDLTLDSFPCFPNPIKLDFFPA